MVSIGEAGNTLYPSLYIILSKGYNIELIEPEILDEYALNMFVASKDGKQFMSDNYLSLLGLIGIWENLGDNLLDRVKEGEQLRLTVVNHQSTS